MKLNFILKGHDTTAAAMTWFLYCMATNTQQQVIELVINVPFYFVADCLLRISVEITSVTLNGLQEMARDEVVRVLGDRPGVTMDDVGDMKHLERCIREALRLYPPVPNFKRRVQRDVELAGHRVPAGASVSLHVYALHRHARHWPEPLAFRPDRFAPDEIARRHPFAFLPFSAGPRNCIGKHAPPHKPPCLFIPDSI